MGHIDQELAAEIQTEQMETCCCTKKDILQIFVAKPQELLDIFQIRLPRQNAYFKFQLYYNL